MSISLFRSRTVAGTAAGAVAGLTVGLGLGLVGPPTASAAPLPAFGGCDELLRWYVDRALPSVGPYGLGGGPVVYGAMESADSDGVVRSGGPVPDRAFDDSAGAPPEAVPEAVPAAGALEARGQDGQTSSGTGTNVQETGVDEPDLAKTDGDLLVRVVGDRLLVAEVGDGQVGEVPDTGTLTLPEDLRASELLLSGTRVLVVGTAYQPNVALSPEADVMPTPELRAPSLGRALPFAPYTTDASRVVEVDLTDPASPRVLSDRTYGGSLLSARQYDDAGGAVVRLVLHTGSPTLDFVQPNRDRSEQEATQENRRIVRSSRLSDWLPQVRDTEGSAGGHALLDCDEVRHPLRDARRAPAGWGDDTATDVAPAPDLGTLSIVTLPFSDPTDTSATAVTTSAQTVYSSTDRLYLALNGPDGTTDVHAFALDGTSTRYAASGSVDGMVRDRWSMDEQDGVLRMAVGHGTWWGSGGGSDNGIVTLREDGGRLRQVGSVRDLGPDEEIKSVRWFDDLAVLVTFRQTDPLYTVDLSDPAAPRTLGALKIPGFSTYLHPLGGGRLLGVGQDAGPTGMTRGSQASVFDVSDLAHPSRLSHLPVDGAMLLAEHDPRALTWVPTDGGGGVVLAGASREIDGRPAIVELRVGADGSLTRGHTWLLGSAYTLDGPATPRALPLGDGRVALVGTGVSVVRVS